MAEGDPNQLAELLKRRLAEQDELRKRFEEASPADSYKDDIDLGEQYRPVTELRMDKSSFLVRHTPTTLLNQWPAMTGPRALRRGVEGWVDEVQKTYPLKGQD